MKIKKVLQGTALTALAAAAWLGANSVDASAATTASLGKDSTGNYVLKVEDSGAKEVVVGVAKVDKKNVAKVASWDVYDTDSANIDLSKLNTANDNYIAIKDKDGAVTFVKIPATSKKNTITFDAASGKITEVKTKVGTTDGTATEVEYRTANSNWSEATVNSTDFTAYQNSQGATLYVRVPAGKDPQGDDAKGTVTYEGEDAAVTVVKSLPSKETKLNIAKRAKGPAVTVDYVKGTLKLKAGVEYRVVNNGTLLSTTGGGIDYKGGIATAGALGLTADKGVLEVRTVAKNDGDAKKHKAASAWTRVEVEKVQGSIIGAGAEVTTGSPVSYTVSGSALKLNYTVDKNKKANGLAIESDAEFAIDYFVGKEAPTADTKYKTLKKKGAKATIKGNDLANGNNVYVRVAGDKKEKQWARAWEILYTIAIPE